MMRRWILKAGTTDLNGLVLEDAPIPKPKAGEIRIRIHAVSLNYRDRIVRRFRFEDAKDAYLAQSSPELFGKIVIDLA